MSEIKLLDVVALIENIPEHGLGQGLVGTVVEKLAQNVYEVEFSDDQGHAYASAAIRSEKLLVLHYQPVRAA